MATLLLVNMGTFGSFLSEVLPILEPTYFAQRTVTASLWLSKRRVCQVRSELVVEMHKILAEVTR